MIEIQIKEDGVWIHAEHNGKHGLLNLNNIVNEMSATITRTAFVGAIKEANQTIEQLEFRDKQSREDMVTMASVNSTLYAKIEQLEGQLTNAVNHLHRAKRRLYDSSFDECIAACNHVLSPPQEKDDV